jgi:peptidoglycan/xylan/chitin deacetylase (PgdA/CDA1 family)
MRSIAGLSSRNMYRFVAITLALAALPLTAAAEPCPGNPDALGTARILTVDPAVTPRIGRKQFPATLPLQDKELVLTFDDGPWPTTTPKVLDALKHECVRATFFLVGRNAAEHPAIVRRELADGHSIGHHTFSHPLLNRLSLAQAEADIERGIAADEEALGGERKPAAPFFRFPGFASSPALLDYAEKRGLAVFGADVWASDWLAMTPEQELALILKRIDLVGRGIVLLHDTKMETARMLPAFLRAVKRRGYRIVHVAPAGGASVSWGH